MAIHVALAELQVGQSDSFIYQRRDGNTSESPHCLGWFGGHMDDGEEPINAIKRELGEETSLDVTKLTFDGPRVFEVPENYASSRKPTIVYLFKTSLRKSDIKFKVYEGSGAEVYTQKELLATNEVAATLRYILER